MSLSDFDDASILPPEIDACASSVEKLRHGISMKLKRIEQMKNDTASTDPSVFQKSSVKVKRSKLRSRTQPTVQEMADKGSSLKHDDIHEMICKEPIVKYELRNESLLVRIKNIDDLLSTVEGEMAHDAQRYMELEDELAELEKRKILLTESKERLLKELELTEKSQRNEITLEDGIRTLYESLRVILGKEPQKKSWKSFFRMLD